MAQGPLPIPVDARELIRHMEWADSSVLRAVLAHAPAHEDGRLRDLLVHLHGVQAAFLAIWASRALPEPPAEPPTLAQIAAFARGCHAEVPAMIAQWGQADLSRPIRMPGLEPYERQIGRPFDSPTLAETVVQVATHSTYHRGQVNARLREIGGEPPLVDFIAWIWFGRPAPEWSGIA